MNTKIPDTGERILLDKETPLMIARHLSAYKFAKNYVYDKAMLDIGCGEGYGSYYLAGPAKEVMAIDYDRVVIDYAKQKYQKDNLRFCAMDVKNLDSLSNKFEIICAFQSIEHINDTAALLTNIKNLLTDDGIFICSTPNIKDASPGSAVPFSKFHVKEYLMDEFKGLLEAYFKKVNMFGLKRGSLLNFYRRLKKTGIFNFLPASINPVRRFYEQIDCGNFIIVKDNLDTALDLIAVCRR